MAGREPHEPRRGPHTAAVYPSMINELGIKSVGESGIISPSAAIANAVEDALADRGVAITRIPLIPVRV